MVWQNNGDPTGDPTMERSCGQVFPGLKGFCSAQAPVTYRPSAIHSLPLPGLCHGVAEHGDPTGDPTMERSCGQVFPGLKGFCSAQAPVTYRPSAIHSLPLPGLCLSCCSVRLEPQSQQLISDCQRSCDLTAASDAPCTAEGWHAARILLGSHLLCCWPLGGTAQKRHALSAPNCRVRALRLQNRPLDCKSSPSTVMTGLGHHVADLCCTPHASGAGRLRPGQTSCHALPACCSGRLALSCLSALWLHTCPADLLVSDTTKLPASLLSGVAATIPSCQEPHFTMHRADAQAELLPAMCLYNSLVPLCSNKIGLSLSTTDLAVGLCQQRHQPG